MTDRELLELAAKAAGYEIEADHHGNLGLCREEDVTWDYWDPLNDDGDAFRLAVKLRLMVAWDRWNNNDYACVRHRDLDEEIGIPVDRSSETAIRRAIVMAAAEIGRAMK